MNKIYIILALAAAAAVYFVMKKNTTRMTGQDVVSPTPISNSTPISNPITFIRSRIIKKPTSVTPAVPVITPAKQKVLDAMVKYLYGVVLAKKRTSVAQNEKNVTWAFAGAKRAGFTTAQIKDAYLKSYGKYLDSEMMSSVTGVFYNKLKYNTL